MSALFALRPEAKLLCGDCIEKLAALEADSIHSCVTDPPYHMTSIVKRFGKEGAAPAKAGQTGAYARASRGFMGKEWDGGDIAFQPETWAAVMRVLKPGGHLLAFGSSKGFYHMAVAIEAAGFEIRDTVMWLYGTGFPKSHNLDGEWEGWGTALKPAFEPIIVARKPLIGTVAANVLAHGTGAINIDACRVPAPDGVPKFNQKGNVATGVYGDGLHGSARTGEMDASTGRFPANVIHDGSDEVVSAFPAQAGAASPVRGTEQSRASNGTVTGIRNRVPGAFHADSGSAARFFYSAKATAAERAGSKHPTVKPIALMRYLCRLVTPPGGRVLDPFAGTGTTGLAAINEGFDVTLIEREFEYQMDIRRRLGLPTPADLGVFG